VRPGVEFFCLTLALNRKGNRETTPLMETGGTIHLGRDIVPRGRVPAFYTG
jgi:hypothetical protein